jgi:hypothetical protein
MDLTPIRRSLCGLGLAAACVLAASCAPTARTTGPYEAKAASTIDAATSGLGTDLLLLRAVAERRALATVISVASSDAESDVSSAASTFASIQPPTARAERLRDRLTDLLDDAVDAASQVRIAARGGDRDGILSARAKVVAARAALEHVERELE